MNKTTARAVAAAAFAALSRGKGVEAQAILDAAPANLRPIADTLLRIAVERQRARQPQAT